MNAGVLPLNAESLPIARLEVRPVTAPCRSSTTSTQRNKLPSRPGTVQEVVCTGDNNNKRNKSSKAKKGWITAFQRINVVQSESGGFQISSGKRSSRLRRVEQVYRSPDFAYIKPKRIDVKQKDFSVKQAEFWKVKFKELLEEWGKERQVRNRLKDILPRADDTWDKNDTTSRRYSDFFKNYSSKYKFSRDKSESPMADEDAERRLNYVPIKHSEIAVIEYEREKKRKVINHILQKSVTILREINSLTRIEKKVYEPNI